MIIIQNRKLLIPNDDRYLGTTYDNNSEIRQFCVDRYTQNEVDLAGLNFKADLRYEDGTTDTMEMDLETAEDHVLLSALFPMSVMSHAGTMLLSIRAYSDDGGVKWASFFGAFYIEERNGVIADPSKLTELEQLEKKVNAAIKAAEKRSKEAVESAENRVTAAITSAETRVSSAVSDAEERSRAAAESAETRVTNTLSGIDERVNAAIARNDLKTNEAVEAAKNKANGAAEQAEARVTEALSGVETRVNASILSNEEKTEAAVREAKTKTEESVSNAKTQIEEKLSTISTTVEQLANAAVAAWLEKQGENINLIEIDKTLSVEGSAADAKAAGEAIAAVKETAEGCEQELNSRKGRLTITLGEQSYVFDGKSDVNIKVSNAGGLQF